MKNIIRFAALTIVFSILIMFIPAGINSFAAEGERDYYNSIIVNLEKGGVKRIYTPEDFPEVDCSGVIVISSEDTIKAILMLKEYGDEACENAMNALKNNPLVLQPYRNYFAYYESVVTLNESKVIIKEGKTVDLKIVYERIRSVKSINTRFIIVLDPNVYDLENIKPDIFAQYGIINMTDCKMKCAT